MVMSTFMPIYRNTYRASPKGAADYKFLYTSSGSSAVSFKFTA